MQLIYSIAMIQFIKMKKLQSIKLFILVITIVIGSYIGYPQNKTESLDYVLKVVTLTSNMANLVNSISKKNDLE